MKQTAATPEQLAVIASRPPSVAHMFFDRVAESGDREAIRYPDADEKWHSLTWGEVGDRVTHLAAGLVALGIEPGQRVAIAASTRYEWILADLAINASAAATTTVYPSTGAEDTAYILSDSESRIVFAEDDEQVKKLIEQRAALPNLTTAITFEPSALGEDWVIGLDELEKRGAQRFLANDPTAIEDRVVDAHRRFARNADLHVRHDRQAEGRPAVARRLDVRGLFDEGHRHPHAEDDLEFRWLPMAHSFGKVLLTAQLAVGLRVGHRWPGAEDRPEPGHHPADLHGCRPSHLREGLRRRQRHDGEGRRREAQALPLGREGRLGALAGCPQRQARSRRC